MAKNGYANFAIDLRTDADLQHMMQQENCRTKTEAVRTLLRMYRSLRMQVEEIQREQPPTTVIIEEDRACADSNQNMSPHGYNVFFSRNEVFT